MELLCRTYFLKKKSDALEKFREYKISVETESGIKIKALRADRGGKYLSETFLERVWNSAIVYSSLFTSAKSIRMVKPYTSRSCQIYA